jgi:hypothetical protein
MVATSHDGNSRVRQSHTEPEARTADGSSQPPPVREQTTSNTAHPLEPLFEQIAVVRAFALHYVEAQTDAARAAIRRTIFKAAAGLGAAIGALTFVIACTIMLAEGLAELISIAAGGRPWVGNLTVGGGVLLILTASVGIYVARQLRRAREQTIRKYESRHYAQRAQFGADVTQRAAT